MERHGGEKNQVQKREQLQLAVTVVLHVGTSYLHVQKEGWLSKWKLTLSLWIEVRMSILRRYSFQVIHAKKNILIFDKNYVWRTAPIKIRYPKSTSEENIHLLLSNLEWLTSIRCSFTALRIMLLSFFFFLWISCARSNSKKVPSLPSIFESMCFGYTILSACAFWVNVLGICVNIGTATEPNYWLWVISNEMDFFTVSKVIWKASIDFWMCLSSFDWELNLLRFKRWKPYSGRDIIVESMNLHNFTPRGVRSSREVGCKIVIGIMILNAREFSSILFIFVWEIHGNSPVGSDRDLLNNLKMIMLFFTGDFKVSTQRKPISNLDK